MARIYWLTGAVAIMPRPLRQSLAAEMVELRLLKVKGLCSLLTENEIKMIGFDVPQTPSQENWLREYQLFLILPTV